ncbi:diacylglycerol kinase family protein [Candidatus Gottesmanbacteria bacterium]|nr:diacylglycerol kinase family protein [Candidatus Gottesmanbacteria bacterium]
MKELLRTHHISFKNAFAGVLWSFRTQPNFRIHALLSAFVLFAASFFQIEKIEYVVLLFAIVLGFTSEMLNTSVESMTDLISTEWKKEAKIAKDVAAGMMLFTAFGTAAIAVIIFYPYIAKLFI